MQPLACHIALGLACVELAAEVSPLPQPTLAPTRVRAWDFGAGTDGWTGAHDCRVSAAEGRLIIVSTDTDPYLVCPVAAPAGRLVVRFRARSTGSGAGQFFWTSERNGSYSEAESRHFTLFHDGAWHDYDVPIEVAGALRSLRFDPGSGPGRVEVEQMELLHAPAHPLSLISVRDDGRDVVAAIRNTGRQRIDFQVGGQHLSAAPGETVQATLATRADRPFEAVTICARAAGLPDASWTVFIHHPTVEAGWKVIKSEGLAVSVAPDGSGARIRGHRAEAIIAPILHRNGAVPAFEVTATADAVRLTAPGVDVRIAVQGDQVGVDIAADDEIEGPVLRLPGSLEQGLFAGLEYLGRGERSSSTLDVETEEHLRFTPDPLKVTMPLMACVTEQGLAAMTWTDMALQPVFAAPNVFDGSADHRMALRGRRIKAAILLREPAPIEDAILWAVKRHGLPPLPDAPRNEKDQWALCLKALDGPLKGAGGWGHCAEPRWERHYADFASTLWRLTGALPNLPQLVAGGAHIRNDAAWFVTGRAQAWLDRQRAAVKALFKEQQPDGSFRYKGRYARGHFEDTASGHCAQRAATLLEHAWFTGDADAKEAGLKTLAYMKRFQVPRGAQTWELSLHTPDILASAHLVRAYVRGHQLTGDKALLAEARRWALSGVPFVYLWGRYPIMPYATIAVYGATNWRSPSWFGRPVQWCGLVYADALALLAPYDETLDWRHLARGILLAGEHMQYPGGRLAGCLPDSFTLETQGRSGPAINPCALVSLRLTLDGQLASLAVAADGKHRIVAPFPVTIRDSRAYLRARAGVTYQVLVDGQRIVDVTSKGEDVLPLEGGP